MTKSEKAAKRFFGTAFPDVGFDYTDHPAKPLIVAAFDLYARAWSSPPCVYDITQWQYPANTLASGAAFEGDQPWSVLLRRAMELRSVVSEHRAA